MSSSRTVSAIRDFAIVVLSGMAFWLFLIVTFAVLNLVRGVEWNDGQSFTVIGAFGGWVMRHAFERSSP